MNQMQTHLLNAYGFMNTNGLPYQQNVMANTSGHGYYTVINGTAWFYDTTVSHQDLQAQNFRLVELLLNHTSQAGQHMLYPPISYLPAPVMIPPSEVKRRKTENKKDVNKKTDKQTNHVVDQRQVNEENTGHDAPSESSTNLCADNEPRAIQITKRKNETDTEWTFPSNVATPTPANVVDNDNKTQTNMYEIFNDGDEEIEHVDVETVISEVSKVDEYLKDSERFDNKSVVTMHDLFCSEGNDINQVSDEDDSAVGHQTEDPGSIDIAVKNDDIPAFDPHRIVKENVQELLENWQSGPKEDRTKAITRISYIARLMQLHQDIEEYVSKGVAYKEKEYFIGVQETLEKLRADIVINTTDPYHFHNVVVKFEKLNLQIGKDMKAIREAYVEISKKVGKCVVQECQNHDPGIVQEKINQSNDIMEPDMSHNEAPLQKEGDNMSTIKTLINDTLIISNKQNSLDNGTNCKECSETQTEHQLCDVSTESTKTSKGKECGENKIKNIETVKAPLTPLTELTSMIHKASSKHTTIVPRTVSHNKRENKDKNPNATKIVTSRYYTHFMDEVTCVKDILRDDIEAYKLEGNDARISAFIHLIQRIQKLIKILPKNIDKQLYKTKCKKLEKIRDTAMYYREEDGRVDTP